MVDRVVDITSSIRGLLNLSDPRISVLGGGVVTRWASYRSTVSLRQHTPNWTVTVNGDVYKDRRFNYSRTPWAPGFSDLVPPVDLGGLTRDLTNTLDLLALIRQGLTGR
jgi:hypothetical protein